MNNQFLAPPLSEEDKVFMYEQRHSEHFKVYQKALLWLYSLEAARLAAVKQEELPVYQGILQGLLKAKNIIILGKVPEQSK